MRNQRPVFCGYIKERGRLAFHMTGVARLFIAHIKRMRRFFRKRGLLQFVGDHERAQKLVVIQLTRHLRFVTCAAKLRLLEQRPHHGTPMRWHVVENLLIGHTGK